LWPGRRARLWRFALMAYIERQQTEYLTLYRQGDARRSRCPHPMLVAVWVAVSVCPAMSLPVYAALRPAPIDTHRHAGNGGSGLLIRWFTVGFPTWRPHSKLIIGPGNHAILGADRGDIAQTLPTHAGHCRVGC
jgi:hypothetical protein